MRKRYEFENMPLCQWKEMQERNLPHLVKRAYERERLKSVRRVKTLEI